MGNPFKRATPPTGATVDPKFSTKLYHHWSIKNSRQAVTGSHDALASADAVVKSFGAGNEIPAAEMQAFDKAAREFNNDVKRLKYSHGKLGASVEGMFKSFADTLGFDTSKWASTKIKGEVGEAMVNVTKIKGNIIERALSKPFRVAASFPKTSLFVGGALAVVGIGSAVKRNSEQKTQYAMQAQVEDLAAQQAAMGQANPYQISPQEAAMLEARMRGGQGPQAGHAEAIAAARQQAAPVAASV